MNLPLTRIIIYQNLGFLGIMTLCYLDDLLQLPSLIFSDHPFVILHRRTTLEMLLVLGVWFVVTASTRRILNRIRYLEEFMRVCAWCRRIDSGGEWMPLEQYFSREFSTKTSHGMCPECVRQMEAKLRDLPGSA